MACHLLSSNSSQPLFSVIYIYIYIVYGHNHFLYELQYIIVLCVCMFAIEVVLLFSIYGGNGMGWDALSSISLTNFQR